MEEIIKILNEVKPGKNFAASTDYIADRLLDSFDILTLTSRLSDEYEVEITVAQLLPENFRSAQAIWDMVRRLQDEE